MARYLPDESGGRSTNVYSPDVNNFTDPKSGKGQKSRENKTRQRKKGEIVKPATLSDDEIQFLRRRQVRKLRTLQLIFVLSQSIVFLICWYVDPCVMLSDPF